MKRFIVILMVLVSAQVFAETAWVSEVEFNPMTDEKNIFIQGSDPAWGRGVYVFLRATGQGYSAYVVFSDYFSDSDNKMLVRFGKEKPQTITCNLSTDGTALFIPSPLKKDFITSLVTFDTLAIQATPYRASPIILVIDTAKLKPILEQYKAEFGL